MVDVSKLTKKRLGELLKEAGAVTEEQIQEALDRQEETDELLGRALVELGHVTEDDIARVVCTQFGLPYVDATNYAPNKKLIEKIPDAFIQKYYFLPLDQIGDVVVVAVSGVFEEQFFHELEELTGAEIQIVISTRRNIETALVSKLELHPAEFDMDETEDYMERDPGHDETAGEPEPAEEADEPEKGKVFSLEETEEGEAMIIDLESEAEKLDETGEGGQEAEDVEEQKAEVR